MTTNTDPPAGALLNDGVRRREVWAWAMYDFANSSYTTVVITALFNAYFVAVVAGNAAWATLAWTAALSASYALIVVTAPLLGALADQHQAKKPLLALTTAGCVLATALLYYAQPGGLWLAILLIVVSNYFYGSGEALIAAFLPELARPHAIGRVSGWGWSLGYVGGIAALGVCLAYVSWAEGQGQSARDFVPVTMLITAALFGVASLPTFLLLRERAVPVRREPAPLAAAWSEVRRTLRDLPAFVDLRRFLLCSLFYQAGIQTVIALTAVYASQAMHFSTRETLLLVLVVNITAAAGALAFGYLQDRIGHVPAIRLTLLCWIGTVLLAAFTHTPFWFWVAANGAGLSMGAAQSGGRALVGVLAPPARRAEFFGFWGLAVKLASIAGPLTYGVATWMSGGDHRRALLITGSYFVVGLLLLAGVDPRRGARTALRDAAAPE